MEVWCGMIMGFDNDDAGIFDRQIEFIQHARISFSMSGMLSAIPKTPLHDRLAAEGRLDLADVSEFGTNVDPAPDQPRRLARGLSSGLERAVRHRRLLRADRSPVPQALVRHRHQEEKEAGYAPRSSSARRLVFIVKGIGLFLRLMTHVGEPAPAPRLPQAALAVLEGPPPSRVRSLLLVPHDDALSRPVPRQTHGQPRAAARQFVLKQVLPRLRGPCRKASPARWLEPRIDR